MGGVVSPSFNTMSITSAFPPGELESVPVVIIVPALRVLLIVTILSSCLIPTTIALFISSSPASRRRPLFILNLCAIALGLCQGVIICFISVSRIHISVIHVIDSPCALDYRANQQAHRYTVNNRQYRTLHSRTHMCANHPSPPHHCRISTALSTTPTSFVSIWSGNDYEDSEGGKRYLLDLLSPAWS